LPYRLPDIYHEPGRLPVAESDMVSGLGRQHEVVFVSSLSLPGAVAMVTPKLGCAYPRCSAPDASNLKRLKAALDGKEYGICECESCGRLMAACTEQTCHDAGTFNRPFVRYCRRCKEEVDQAPEWEQAQSDGWNLIPQSIGEPQVLADFSGLGPKRQPASSAIAMIRGVLAVHQAGQYLALVKVKPGARGDALLWVWDERRYPFPDPSDGLYYLYAPMLLPGERYLVYSCAEGVLVLDLWSCQGLSAKDNVPKHRLIRCKHRSLVAAPIAVGNGRIGLVLKDWSSTDALPFRWAVWDLETPDGRDREFESGLDSPQTGQLPLSGEKCRCEVVGNRVITFSTGRQQWVWRIADAAVSRIDEMKQTWPTPQTKDQQLLHEQSNSTILDDRTGHLTRLGPIPPDLPFQGRRAEKFSWFSSVQRGDPASTVLVERYEVDFESLGPTFPQSIEQLSGARPIGSAPNQDKTLQMYFRAGTDIWYQSEGSGASHFQGGLPDPIRSLRLFGPLVVSVGENDREQESIQIDSLHHRGGHAVVPIENKLLSDPLLWYHWLFTIELDPENRVQAYRRTVTFEKPRSRK
jgi:hypothetical protein